jgi:citrate synthase
MRKANPIRSDIAWSARDRIVVRGKDLPSELIGHLNLGDFAFLQLTGRAPEPPQSRMFNAILVTLAEHGITPSAIAARMTYLGAPEAMQAAVAAGLCGLGSVFVGSTEAAARMLYEKLSEHPGGDISAMAEEVAAAFHRCREIIPGARPPHPQTRGPADHASVNSGWRMRIFGLLRWAHAADSHRRRACFGQVGPNQRNRRDRGRCCELGLPWRAAAVIGPIARSVRDVALTMTVVTEPDDRADAWSAPSRMGNRP